LPQDKRTQYYSTCKNRNVLSRFWPLALVCVRIKTDPKTVQTLLRHSQVRFTLQFYTHSISDDRMAATGAMLVAILGHAADRSGLRADWSGT
jgi:hypothetical protein